MWNVQNEFFEVMNGLAHDPRTLAQGEWFQDFHALGDCLGIAVGFPPNDQDGAFVPDGNPAKQETQYATSEMAQNFNVGPGTWLTEGVFDEMRFDDSAANASAQSGFPRD